MDVLSKIKEIEEAYSSEVAHVEEVIKLIEERERLKYIIKINTIYGSRGTDTLRAFRDSFLIRVGEDSYAKKKRYYDILNLILVDDCAFLAENITDTHLNHIISNSLKEKLTIALVDKCTELKDYKRYSEVSECNEDDIAHLKNYLKVLDLVKDKKIKEAMHWEADWSLEL